MGASKEMYGQMFSTWTAEQIAGYEYLKQSINPIITIKKMKSKITNITGNGTFDSKHGLLYKFEYTFEDGVTIAANHKTNASPFTIGQEIEYEVKGTNDYGAWGSVKKPDENFNNAASASANQNSQTSNDDRQKLIVAQSSLKAAVEFHNSTPADEAQVIATADTFFNWVMSK
jgi:hypothetical protein